MLPIIRSVLVLTAFSLAACGGGGGDKKTPSTSSASSTPVSSAQASSTRVASTPASSTPVASAKASSTPVSSAQASVQPSSALASSAPAVLVKLNGTVKGFSTLGVDVRLDAALAKVELHLLDSKEQIVASASPIASSFSESDELRFSADISGAGATSVAVTVSYPGYTSYSRKLDAEEQINFDAKLQVVPTATVEPDISTSISGVSVEGFNIAVANADDPLQSDSLSIQIPSSLLPEGTDSLDVAVRTFDPNDPVDAEFFPGAYADSDGNQLASVAFNFAEISTVSGEPLVAAMKKARQQKLAKLGGQQQKLVEEPVVINRQIPAQSCGLLESLGDSAADMAGFQVPVYTYNPKSGLWDLLGQGTIYTENGQQVAATQTQFSCDTENFFLEILVTNEIFLSDWWNLDYPLFFNQPTTYCASIQLKNPEGKALSGVTGFLIDQDDSFNFASTYFTTDDQGRASISVSQSSVNPDLSAEVFFYNEADFGYVTQPVTLSTNCTDSAPQVIELKRPELCEVNGQFSYDNGAPVTRNLVYGFPVEGANFVGFDFASSDETGAYRLNLPCGGHYQIVNFATSFTPSSEEYQLTTIDGNLDADEASDDGKVVVMKPLQITPRQPLVYGEYDAASDQLMLFAIGTFDLFPMTAQVTIKSLDGSQVHETFSGTFTAASVSGDDEMELYYGGTLSRTAVLPDSDGYQLEMTLKDAFGNTWANIPGLINPPDEEE
ncbi:MAG TPA: hypothetical protein VLC79_12285 [Cellvibrio sp.]|nr:hypothetical protein [Cellvibrio sp.]